MEEVSAQETQQWARCSGPVFKWLQANVSSYLQSSGSQEYAGTGDGLRLEPHKHVSPQGIVHVVPTMDKNTLASHLNSWNNSEQHLFSIILLYFKITT